MVTEYKYISIKEILSRLLRHPLLQEVTLEQVIQYTIDFIGVFGFPKMYQDKEETIHISEYRGELPCDLISIIQVKNKATNTCLRYTSDSFSSKETENQEDTFKTQGNYIYTSFKEGDIIIAYKSIPVDKDGYPMLIDNPVFMRALEGFIKKEIFGILFDLNKISQNVYQNVQTEYAWRAGQCKAEFTLPSVSEMETIANSWCTLVQRRTSFYSGFKNDGNMELIRQH